MTAYSFTRVSKAEQCGLAYQHAYIFKERGPKTDALKLGTLVHATLEQAIAAVMEAQYIGTLNHEKVMQMYGRKYAEAYDGGGSLQVFEDGAAMVRSWLARVGPVDYRRYMAIEESFVVDVGGISLRGVVDLVEQEPDGSITVVDYKTNRALYTRQEVEESLQLGIYALAASILYPGREVRLAYDMLRHGVRMYTSRTPEQLDAVRRYVQTIADRIERWKQGGPDSYKPTLNRFCSWCDFRDRCPAYTAALEVGNIEEVTEDGTVDDVVIERERLAIVEKAAKTRRYELDRVLRDIVAQDGPRAAGGMLIDVRPTTSRTYPPDVVAEVLGQLLGLDPVVALAKVAKVDNSKLKKAIADAMGTDENAACQAQVALDVAAKTRTTSRLSVRHDRGIK